MTTLIFVRHGQSEGNLVHRFIGHGDAPLTELGHAQAACTADFLKDYPIEKIYSSDLRRAMQTAAPTAAMHGLEIQPRSALREIAAGRWEGKLYEDLTTEFPDSYGVWLKDIGRACPDGGERVVDLAARVYAEVDRILEADRNRTVAIFTHATPIRMMACRWYGIPPEEASQVPFGSNASVSIVEYDDDGHSHLVCYAYDRHQGNQATQLPPTV